MSVSRLRSSKELRPLVDRRHTHWQPQLRGNPPAGRAVPKLVHPQAPSAELGFLRARLQGHPLPLGWRGNRFHNCQGMERPWRLPTQQCRPLAATATSDVFLDLGLQELSPGIRTCLLCSSPPLRLFRVKKAMLHVVLWPGASSVCVRPSSWCL